MGRDETSAEGRPTRFIAWLLGFIEGLRPAAAETTRRGQWIPLHFVEISEAKVRLATANATARELENLEKAIDIVAKLRDMGEPAWISRDGRVQLGHEPPTDQGALEVAADAPLHGVSVTEEVDVEQGFPSP